MVGVSFNDASNLLNGIYDDLTVLSQFNSDGTSTFTNLTVGDTLSVDTIIPNLNSAVEIDSLDSITFNCTTGTITTLVSTTGTIATLNSTIGTITTLVSTIGTIITLSLHNIYGPVSIFL